MSHSEAAIYGTTKSPGKVNGVWQQMEKQFQQNIAPFEAAAKVSEAQGAAKQKAMDMKWLYIGGAALVAWYFLSK